MGYTGVMHTVASNCKDRISFFYSDNCKYRFAVPKRTIWTKGNDIGMTFFRMLGESMLKVIDYDRAIVGYRDDRGTYKLDECYLTKDLLSAIKQAKKKKSAYVVDLQTNQLLETNG